MTIDPYFSDLCILDSIEARETADAVRAEAQRRWDAGELPIEERVGWQDAAAWIDGSEVREP